MSMSSDRAARMLIHRWRYQQTPITEVEAAEAFALAGEPDHYFVDNYSWFFLGNDVYLHDMHLNRYFKVVR